MKYGRRPATIFVDEFQGKADAFEVRQELEVRANDVSYLPTHHDVRVKPILQAMPPPQGWCPK